jgi:hypothetical protein
LNVYFKFKPDATPADRARTLRTLREGGATKVARLFPATTQPDLKQHYVAEARTAAQVRDLTRLLRSGKDIAYVQREVRRGPL